MHRATAVVDMYDGRETFVRRPSHDAEKTVFDLKIAEKGGTKKLSFTRIALKLSHLSLEVKLDFIACYCLLAFLR